VDRTGVEEEPHTTARKSGPLLLLQSFSIYTLEDISLDIIILKTTIRVVFKFCKKQHRKRIEERMYAGNMKRQMSEAGLLFACISLFCHNLYRLSFVCRHIALFLQ
jgi:hypothetical protein